MPTHSIVFRKSAPSSLFEWRPLRGLLVLAQSPSRRAPPHFRYWHGVAQVGPPAPGFDLSRALAKPSCTNGCVARTLHLIFLENARRKWSPRSVLFHLHDLRGEDRRCLFFPRKVAPLFPSVFFRQTARRRGPRQNGSRSILSSPTCSSLVAAKGNQTQCSS